MQLSIRRAGIAIVLAAIAGATFALGWQQADDAGRSNLPGPGDVEWRPAKPAIPDPTADAKILEERQPFGAPAVAPGMAAMPAAPGPAGVPAPPPVQWRVTGLVTTEANRYLIVMIRKPGENSSRREIRHAGETLPDGSIVRSIEPTSVTVDRQGTIIRIKMFAQN